MRRLVLALAALAGLFLPGCALFSKGEPGVLRYFSLDGRPASRPPDAGDGQTTSSEGAPKLRLGRVTGLVHLEERLVARDTAHELEFSPDLRWSEPPAEALKRILARVLFEERGLSRVVGGAGPTLDVELTALDELRGPVRRARAQVVAMLHDDRRMLWEETVTVELPVKDAGGSSDEADASLVEALGSAFKAVIERVADRVLGQLVSAASGVTEAK